MNLDTLTSSKFISNVDTHKDGSAGSVVSSAPNKIHVLGAPGYYYFTFQAISKTNEPVELLFSYQKAWQKLITKSLSVSVKITVY